MWMLLVGPEKVSGILVGDQIFARGEEKRRLLALSVVGRVSDHEDANLVGEGMGSGDVGYSRDGSKNCSEDKRVVWACWLSPRPDLSVFYPFPRSKGSLSAVDSGT